MKISAQAGSEWSASRPSRFTPGERAPGTHWIGYWVGSCVDLDAVEKRKILYCLELKLGRPASSPFIVAIPTPEKNMA
jgi:hypothetical protein